MSEMTPIEVHQDTAAVARRGAELMAAHARAAIDARGSFSVAVSGGRTPWAMFAELAAQEVAWSRVAIYQVDERITAAGDDNRNLTHLLASLPAPARERVVAMPVEDTDLDAAADGYAARLPMRFDLVHLGLGPDGHTASLVPGDPALDVLDRDVTLSGPYQGTRRMTLTYPVLDRARARLWVVTGEDKPDPLRRMRQHDASIPAGRVKAEDSLILADAAAAGV
ncbi:MAG TPA: 6-phosphogluconolactonase [Solirubrobacteraceae bacterium]|jgi:6-phosphogluconolactonase|nr:6-phosphogluconolactonase [Solirubrobacteraceae bacterium]